MAFDKYLRSRSTTLVGLFVPLLMAAIFVSTKIFLTNPDAKLNRRKAREKIKQNKTKIEQGIVSVNTKLNSLQKNLQSHKIVVLNKEEILILEKIRSEKEQASVVKMVFEEEKISINEIKTSEDKEIPKNE